MIRLRGRTTELRLEAAEKRPRRNLRPYRARTLIEGRCRECGKARHHYKHRCDVCQAKEHARWNRKYGNNFAWFKKRPKTKTSDGKPPRNPQDFVRNMIQMEKMGWDVAERIRRRRRK